MRRSSVITTIATTTTLVAFAAGDAEARLDLYVDKSVQQMSVIQNGRLLYVWPLSTGRDKFSAPSGVYTPERLERSWFSRAYYNSPMPHAIFFHGGYVIHGSDDISKVGGPASRGCIRLHPDDAALLFSMVKLEGPDNTVIFIDGDSGRPPRPYGSFDDPALRRADAMVRNPYPPPRGADPYVDGGGAYPPPDPPMPPYAGRHVDGRGAYPPGPDAAPYGDQYGDGRSAPRGPGAPPDYTVDPYGDRHGVPHGAGTPRDYDGDRYADRRAGPRAPGMPPDYAVDPYGDGRGARRGPAGPPDDRERYADRRSGPPDPRLPPDYPADPYGRGGRYGPAAAPYPLADHHGGGPGADP
ncbi:MAG: L,D-transpeptidase family protein, partial [Bradyrhizobiaceae bacterium]|nr:L,D-transpeptidase family protein [Bradyrhizobiaceae bacterium]